MSVRQKPTLTNEERRVCVYPKDDSYTVASSIKPSTPLESLNLNWREIHLPQKDRTKHVHGLHPYLGKFIPQIVEVFLRKYFERGQVVLDPFCGSGTTLVQANELGVSSIGYDVSAFNVMLSRVKTDKYELPVVRKEIKDILGKANQAAKKNPKQMEMWDVPFGKLPRSKVSKEYLCTWFAPRALAELLAFSDLIGSEGYVYQDLLKVILTRSARSARLTTHFDLDFPKEPQTESYWCYKHARTCAPVQEAYKFILRYSLDTLRRIEEYCSIRTEASVCVHHEDSREARFESMDGVITSPPYVGLIDYHEQHAYAYHLLGLKDVRCKEIGPASNGYSEKARTQYRQGITEVFARMLPSVKTGGRIIVVAGDTYGLYPTIAADLGVIEEAEIRRHVNRRTGRRTSAFYESVFIWQKH
jgi:DNA modification methylase